MSATTDRVFPVVDPVAQRLGLRVYDIDQPGGTLRVMLDADGGVDIDTLADASREISDALDASDPVAGSYTLEVSSPGLERPLRRPEHFEAAIGERVKVKLMPGVEGDRRADGTLSSCGGETITISTESGDRTVSVADISKATTVFEWSPPPKPGRGGGSGRSGAQPTPVPTTESSEDTR